MDSAASDGETKRARVEEEVAVTEETKVDEDQSSSDEEETEKDPNDPPTYWYGTGAHQKYAKVLDEMDNKPEGYKRAIRIYYDVYNNGLINHLDREGRKLVHQVFGVNMSNYTVQKDEDEDEPYIEEGEDPADYVTYDVFSPVLLAKIERRMDRIVLAAAKEAGLHT